MKFEAKRLNDKIIVVLDVEDLWCTAVIMQQLVNGVAKTFRENCALAT